MIAMPALFIGSPRSCESGMGSAERVFIMESRDNGVVCMDHRVVQVVA